ncbi:hypothetical protein NLJ89_g3375 [Agrocybe chaxingu]|uniref:Uncharacterized protein n=1 Tax=Agrocybe chaxingu TaxID=84603 RepID=A0A9W8MXE5_9AGAR|nr:hypothetical protein NLJ89_g3375 [Agrocybe chaxingu]
MPSEPTTTTSRSEHNAQPGAKAPILFPFEDYQLPGLRNNPKAALELMAKIAFAYDVSYNKRGLESFSYAFWEDILKMLVVDMKKFVWPMPQLLAYYSSGDSDEDGGYISAKTEPDSEATNRIPDFTCIGAVIADHLKGDYTDLQRWDQIVIQNAKPVIVMELKSFGSRRSITIEDYTSNVVAKIVTAQEQALLQAAVIFHKEANIRADRLLLLVGAGEWWSFRLIKKDEKDVKRAWGILEEQDKRKKKGLGRGKQRKNEDQKGEEKQETRQPEQGSTHKPKPMRYATLMEPWTVECVKNIEDCRPGYGAWSKPLCLGTKPSNQNFRYVHEAMQDLVNSEVNSSEGHGSDHGDLENDPLDVI